jgi:tight adherence protein C
MTFLLTVLVFLFTVFLVLGLGLVLFSRRQKVSERLTDIRKLAEEADTDVILRLPFIQRVVIPALDNLGNVLGRLAPGEIRSKVENKILYAGTPWNITFAGVVASQVLLGGAFLAMALSLLRFMQIDISRIIFITLILVFVGFMLPIGIINSKGEGRQKAIKRAMPDTLDLLQVSVEAGLGFDMALKRVTQQMKGPLSEEIRRALDEIRMGGSRGTALRGIAKRSGVNELSSFISAVIQAEELGGNISNTLRAQADYMRQRRRQWAEEMAMKAPVKMVFPMLFFIFPALFVVILAPAVISIIRVFGTML